VDFNYSHSVEINADPWAEEVRLWDIELRFNCSAMQQAGCGHASISNWRKKVVPEQQIADLDRKVMKLARSNAQVRHFMTSSGPYRKART
jgi:hypothetical protein